MSYLAIPPGEVSGILSGPAGSPALPLSENLHIVTIQNSTVVRAINGVFAPLSYVIYGVPLGLIAIVAVAIWRSTSQKVKGRVDGESP